MRTHKVPDIEELSEQRKTDGDETYRVYKFQNGALEVMPRGGPQYEGSERLADSVVSPATPPWLIETTTLTSRDHNHRKPITSYDNYRPPLASTYLYQTPEAIENHKNYQRKRMVHRPEVYPTPTSDTQTWQSYDPVRIEESNSTDRSIATTSDDYECANDDDDENVLGNTPSSEPTVQDGNKCQVYETNDDEVSWNSRNYLQTDKPIQSVPSLLPRYPQHYSLSSHKKRGFEQFDRNTRIPESKEIQKRKCKRGRI